MPNHNHNHNAEHARRDILNPDLGFYVARQIVAPDTFNAFRDACQHDFDTLPARNEKPRTTGLPGFIMPLVYDQHADAHTAHRLYRFLHEDLPPHSRSLIDTIIALRDAIEAPWANRDSPEAQLSDILMVNRYLAGSAGYPRHTDAPADQPQPTLQCWLPLSTPGTDYTGGELLLHAESTTHRVFEHLSLEPGDVLYFDKRVEHEVEPAEPTAGGIGRCIALVGARVSLAPAGSSAA